ncbi:MAG: hypothetical protein IIA89_07745 [Chloroflexi bacterium]|nr:hypothetical protein [Chloroflexota bacterium]
MALPSGTYTHREHVDALRIQLRLDPLQPGELGGLVAKSIGREASASGVSQARARLSAPSTPSAFYSALAVGVIDDPLRLTDLEVDVIRLLASGATSQEIGQYCGHTTVASQANRGAELLKSARSKLMAENNVHLIRIAYRVRLIEPAEGSPPLPPWTD